MATKYHEHYTTGATPQREQAHPAQKANEAGGFSFQVNDWGRLDRFLILGNEGGTLYASERQMTRENAKNIIKLIKSDGIRVVERIVDVSVKGLAYKNDPALFALALCFSEGDTTTRQVAAQWLNSVARIGTHLFTFIEYVNAMRGWGRCLRGAVANWYLSKSPKDLAYQVTKYAQRGGWSHRDALRLSHPQSDGELSSILNYAVGKSAWEDAKSSEALTYLEAVEYVKRGGLDLKAKQIIGLIRDHNLPREVIATELLTRPDVWEALLANMPMTAMIRNIATMTRVGLLKPMSDAENLIRTRLSDVDALRKARIHPIQVLAALTTYASGKGARGQNTWTPNQRVVDALDAAFYLTFKSITPTGKRNYYAIDCSGSMTWGTICGVPGLDERHGAAAMALTLAASEENWFIYGFSVKPQPIAITPRMRLDDAMGAMNKVAAVGTDCAQPILHAQKEGINVDCFTILTDSETWAGQIHPHEALVKYRNKTGINAKLVVVGMTSNEFTIANPDDAGMLDVVGFASDTPSAIANFVRG